MAITTVVTLPIICALRTASTAEKAVLRKAIEEGDLTHLTDILTIIEKNGALESARQSAMIEAQRAMDAARMLPVNDYSAALLQLPAGLMERRS